MAPLQNIGGPGPPGPPGSTPLDVMTICHEGFFLPRQTLYSRPTV